MIQVIDFARQFVQNLLKLSGLGLTLFAAGCAAPQVEVRTVRVPVPIACAEPVPARPSMPTQHLVEPTVAEWVRAALAEIERREGYEQRLVVALDNCRAPITPDKRP